jgi:competence protein ComFC
MRRQIHFLVNVFETVIDVVLPLRERSARTKSRTLDEIPLMPMSHDLLGAKITTLMDYKDPAVQDLVQSLKYDGSGHAARLAADVLADYLREEVASQKNFSARNVLLVPVPLHKKRRRERGFNQIGRVLERLPAEFRDGEISALSATLLVRSRETKPQTRLPRSERLSNVIGAFEVTDASTLKSSHIFLIDDVTTTGATLVHAGHPLKKAGATVTLLALARA